MVTTVRASSTTPEQIQHRKKVRHEAVIKQLIKKIHALLKRLRHYFAPWTRSTFSLTPEQIFLRTKIQQGIEFRSLQQKVTSYIATGMRVNEEEKEKEQTLGAELGIKHTFREFSHALVQVQEFAVELTDKTIDKAFDHFVSPALDKVKEQMETIPATLQNVAEMAVQIGIRSVKTIFNRIRQVRSRIQACAEVAGQGFIDKIKTQPEEAKRQPIIKWLCNAFRSLPPNERTEIQNSLKEDLESYIKEMGITLRAPYDTKSYVNRALEWATTTNRIVPVEEGYKANLVHSVWNQFIIKMLDKKLPTLSFEDQDEIDLKNWFIQPEGSENIRESAKKLLQERIKDMQTSQSLRGSQKQVNDDIEKALNQMFSSTAPTSPALRRKTDYSKIFEALLTVLIEKRLKTHLPIVSEELNETNQNLLNWLLTDKNSEEETPKATLSKEELLNQTLEKATEKLCATQKNKTPQILTGYQTLENHVSKVVDWFKNEGYRPTLEEYLSSEEVNQIKYDRDIIDLIFESVLQILLRKKIDLFFDRYHKIFTDSLPGIVRNKILKNNANKIAMLCSERLCDLIDNLAYTETIDELTFLANNFISAYLEGEKHKNASKKGFERVVSQVNATAVTEAEKQVQETAKETKAYVDGYGLDNFLEKMFIEGFAKPGIFSSGASALLCNASSPEGSEAQKVRLEHKMLYDFTDRILKIFFPPKTITKPDGTSDTIDGIAYICYQLTIPSEFLDLKKEADKMLQQIFPQSVQKSCNVIIEQIRPHLTNLAFGALRDLLHKSLLEGLHKSLIKIAQPEVLIQLLTKQTLPMLEKGMIETMALKLLEEHSQTFSKDFRLLIKPIGTTEEELKNIFSQVATSVLPELRKHVKENCYEYKPIINSFSNEELNKRLLPALDIMAQYVARGFAGKELPGDDKTANNQIAAYMKNYSKTPDKKTEHANIYGELIYNLIFNIGEFNLGKVAQKAVDLFSGKVKKKAGEGVAQAFADYRDSYHNTVYYLLRTLREKLLSEEALARMFSNEEAGPEVGLTLKKQVNRISKLLYDTIGGNSWVKRNTVLAAVSINVESLQNTLVIAINKVFHNNVLNEGLLFTITQIAVSRLEESAEKIRNRDIAESLGLSRTITSEGCKGSVLLKAASS